MKRVAVILLCCALLFSVLAGCHREDTVKELSEARDSGELRIGVFACPPFTYYIDGEWSGFDISLARDVCRKLSLEPVFVEVEWENKYDALKNNEVDCLWCGIAINEDLEEVSFSQTYLTSRPVLLALKDTKACLSLAAESDSTASQFASSFGAVRVISAGSCVDAVSMVMEGKADGAVVDVLYAEALVNGQLEIRELEQGPEELAIAFRKDSDLVPAVNRAITELERSGALGNLAERYAVSDNLIFG